MEYTATIYRSGQAVASNEADTWKALLIWADNPLAHYTLLEQDVLIIKKYVGRDKNLVSYYERFKRYYYNNGWAETFP